MKLTEINKNKKEKNAVDDSLCSVILCLIILVILLSCQVTAIVLFLNGIISKVLMLVINFGIAAIVTIWENNDKTFN